MAFGMLSLFCAIGVSGWVGCPTNSIVPPASTTHCTPGGPNDARQLTIQPAGGFAGVDRQSEDRGRGTHAIAQLSAARS